ncbi:tail protein X [Pararhizobium haloflavum]|uniref:tail protein X n=1 Tax=Pararhizobium haloflavum TaxID=2037914 RepID=UPI000C1A2B41|nr:tail protein X [Pararhizobium haloflavum]
MPKQITIRGEGIVLDQILAAELGPRLARELLPATLALNPGLADQGPFLPVGTVVVIPDRPGPVPFAARPVVRLFG